MHLPGESLLMTLGENESSPGRVNKLPQGEDKQGDLYVYRRFYSFSHPLYR